MSAASLRVLVTGGRDMHDRDLVWRTLDEIGEPDDYGMPTRHLVVIHGGCPTGADEWADRWAASVWICPEVYPADWAAHGRAAGPLRNARMIAEGRPDLVIAFPGGRGTADCVRKARAAGIPVREVATPAADPRSPGRRPGAGATEGGK